MFNCSFMWIKRTCNAAAHVTARFALLSSPLLCFNKDSVPEVIMSVCKRDHPLYSLGFSFISLQLIKKKKKKKIGPKFLEKFVCARINFKTQIVML